MNSSECELQTSGFQSTPSTTSVGVPRQRVTERDEEAPSFSEI